MHASNVKGRETKETIQVTAAIKSLLTFHLSTAADLESSLCGEGTEITDIPLASYGVKEDKSQQNYAYCAKCARLAEKELRRVGVCVELPKRDEAALNREFTELCGRSINPEQQMEVEWHEDIRLAALRARERLHSNDTQELRDQIMEAVDGDVSARIYGSVFSGEPKIREKCMDAFKRHTEEPFL